MNDDKEFLVGVQLMAIPDGLTGTTGRLSLQVSPKPDPSDSELRIDIRRWPECVNAVSQFVRIGAGRFATGDPALTPVNPYWIATVPANTPEPKDPRRRAADATTLWTRLFVDHDDSSEAGFRSLIVALRKSLNPPPPAGLPVRTIAADYSTEALGQNADSLYALIVADSFNRVGNPDKEGYINLWRTLRAGFAPGTEGTRVLDALRQMHIFGEDWSRGEPSPEAVLRDRLRRTLALHSAVDAFRNAVNVPDVDSSTAKTLATRMARAVVQDPFQEEMTHFRAVWGIRSEPPVPPDAAEERRRRDEETKQIIERTPIRKLRGMLSLPTLAKYLGLIVDVEVDLGLLRARFESGSQDAARLYGALAAQFAATGTCTNPHESLPTNQTLGPMTAGELPRLRWTGAVWNSSLTAPFFGPCSTLEASGRRQDDSDPFRDGIIDLTVRLTNPTNSNATIQRFGATATDVVDTILGVAQTGIEIDDADARGAMPDDQSTRLPTRPSRGIIVTDAAVRIEHAKVELARKRATAGASPIVWFAELLLEGFRFDVATVKEKRSTCSDRSRWRPLVARDIGYPFSETRPNVHPAFILAIQPQRSRDDGVVRSMVGSTRYTDEQGTTETIKFIDELFTWTGESLAIPSLHQERLIHCTLPEPQKAYLDPRFDLGIDLTYDLPDGSGDASRCSPPLREGYQYMFGARACFLNGCGLTLKEALPAYTSIARRVVLGDKHGMPLPFNRSREQHAPEVLLPWDDRIVSTKDPPRETPGESVTTLVVRSGSTVTSRARRFLMPPRVGFDACELTGAFDRSKDRRPAGAFEGRTKFVGDPLDGSFPLAVDGGWIDSVKAVEAQGPRDSNGRRSPREGRGPVLVLSASADPPQQRYYADPYASSVCARFLEGEAPAKDLQPLDEPVDFWPPGHSFTEALPIILDVRRGNDLASTVRAQFEQRIKHRLASQYRGNPLLLPSIAVALAPAADVELELWTHYPKPQVEHSLIVAAVRSSSLLQATVRAESERNGSGPAPNTSALSKQLLAAPIATITSRKRLRLIHAVDRPLRVPAFRAQESPQEIRAVVITTHPAPSASSGVASTSFHDWQAYADSHGYLSEMLWPSEEGGSTTFFVGTVLLNRPSTGTLRCMAEWKEYEPAGVTQDPKSGLYAFVPRPVPGDQLFAIDRISTRIACRDKPLRLLTTDESAEPGKGELEYRALAYSFPDGKARQLTLQLIGTSRFTSFYRPETPAENRRRLETGVGKHDLAAQAPQTLWVPSTSRPSLPDIDRVMPLFRWHTTKDAVGKTMTWCRRASLRIYMGGTTWHSTGEGEQLAVTFGPSKVESGDELGFCDFERAVGVFRDFVTRWGEDPIQVSGGLKELMPIGSLTNGDLLPDQLRLPYGLLPLVTSVSPDTATVPDRTNLTIYGENFVNGATVTIQNKDQGPVDWKSESELTITTRGAFTAPLDVVVRNPELVVSVKAFTPTLHPREGLWCVDLDIDPGASHSPFVQLGLARYQPHCAPNLELSRPVVAWAQIPPMREGFATIGDDRRVVVQHHGVGFSRACPTTAVTDSDDGPLLNLRLLRASTPGHVPPLASGEPAWLPVLDHTGQPIVRLGVKPSMKDGEAWWSEYFDLPPCRPGIRYGLLIEEVELMDADPEPTEYPNNWQHKDGCLYVTTLKVERTPLFGHIVDLGE